jgi:hypothetical protein
MTRAAGCQRIVGARGEHWWMCHRCHQTWNDRNTGPHWRPIECPERKKGRNRRGEAEAYRHRTDHNGS